MSTVQPSATIEKGAAREAIQRLDETSGIWASLSPKNRVAISELSLSVNELEKKVRELMKGPVSKLCPACKKSCCAYTSYCYLNMTDEIQYFALGRQIQLEQAIVGAYCAGDSGSTKTRCLLFEEGCGCRLPGDLRPWTCVRFICDDMWLEIAGRKAEIRILMKSISEKRKEIQRIMKKRPSPHPKRRQDQPGQNASAERRS